jgi:hypothetical protein
MKTPKISLLLDSARGQYIPRDFVTGFALDKFQGLEAWAVSALQNPDDSAYWEAWESVLNNASYTEAGRVFTLHQDGDLWLLCIDEMSEDEKSNFFGEC